MILLNKFYIIVVRTLPKTSALTKEIEMTVKRYGGHQCLTCKTNFKGGGTLRRERKHAGT